MVLIELQAIEQAVGVRVEGEDNWWVVLDLLIEKNENEKDFGLEETKALVLEGEMKILSQGLKQ